MFKSTIKTLLTFSAIFFVISATIFYCVYLYSQDVLAQNSSSDAIAIKIIANPNHFSALDWYRQQDFKGSPQSTVVDGYEAVRDGRTVYVNVANVVSGASANNLYTNIYLISYNQEAEKTTTDIFGKIISRWKFNFNVDQIGHCRQKNEIVCTLDNECALGDFCDSQKARVIRDVKRLAAINGANRLLSSYYSKLSYYPKLSAGTYLPRRTISVWPSWQDELGKSLGGAMPIDPVNKIGLCPGYNTDTCWNEETRSFATVLPDLPNNSLVYSYAALLNGTNYDFCAVFESGLNFPLAPSARPICALPVCLDFDGDGYGRPASPRCPYPGIQDCDDSNNLIGGGAAEVCNNGIDDDCDGFVDCFDFDCLGNSICSALLTCNGNFICDGDEDCNNCPSDCGVCPVTCPNNICSAASNECNTCYDPSGTLASHSLDCFCGDGVVCSSRGEQCDDGNNNNGDGCSSTCQIEVFACTDNDHDGYSLEGGGSCCGMSGAAACGPGADCNDGNSSIRPGATEICDGIDNNCNGLIDEGFFPEQCPYVCASLGFIWVGNATLLLPALNCCGNDSNEAGPYQAIETNCFDGRDNNCNGLIDSADANCGGGCNNTGEDDHINAATPSQCNQCTVNGDQDGDQTTDNPAVDWLSPAGIADTCDSDCNTAMSTTTPRSRYNNSENTVALCTDGYDNDCNGYYDCYDSTCLTATTACCVNECALLGSRGCAVGTTTVRWECGNFDADPCLERLEFSCGMQICDSGTGNCVAACTNNDGDGYSLEGGGNCCGATPCGSAPDCDDDNPYVYPGGTETCDGYDNNCNSIIDEGCDDDGDDYCDAGMGYYPNWGIPPYLPIGPNPCPNTTSVDNRDCDDTNTAIRPGATEVCNGLDDNCNGLIDESLPTNNPCPLTQGICSGVYQVCTSGAWLCNYGASYQATEANCSDGLDNDCDGLTDCEDTANCGADPYCSTCTFTFTLPCTFP